MPLAGVAVRPLGAAGSVGRAAPGGVAVLVVIEISSKVAVLDQRGGIRGRRVVAGDADSDVGGAKARVAELTSVQVLPFVETYPVIVVPLHTNATQSGTE